MSSSHVRQPAKVGLNLIPEHLDYNQNGNQGTERCLEHYTACTRVYVEDWSFQARLEGTEQGQKRTLPNI
jgi:hypothetical protein